MFEFLLGTLLVVLFAVAASAVVMLYLSWHKERYPEETVTAKSEWLPTGKIDFHCTKTPTDDKVPGSFLLRVEDYRTVESISGVEHVEIRWRNATLAEAKSVVVAHQNYTNGQENGYQFRRLLKAPPADVIKSADLASGAIADAPDQNKAEAETTTATHPSALAGGSDRP